MPSLCFPFLAPPHSQIKSRWAGALARIRTCHCYSGSADRETFSANNIFIVTLFAHRSYRLSGSPLLRFGCRARPALHASIDATADCIHPRLRTEIEHIARVSAGMAKHQRAQMYKQVQARRCRGPDTAADVYCAVVTHRVAIDDTMTRAGSPTRRTLLQNLTSYTDSRHGICDVVRWVPGGSSVGAFIEIGLADKRVAVNITPAALLQHEGLPAEVDDLALQVGRAHRHDLRAHHLRGSNLISFSGGAVCCPRCFVWETQSGR